jgi:hypothetical protein
VLKSRVKLEGNGNSDMSGAARERLEAELFVNPPARLGRATRAVTSSATLRTTPKNDNGQVEQGGTREGNGERLEAELFVNPPALPTRAVTSSATRRAASNNDNGRIEQSGTQEGNRQSTQQPGQARGDGDKGDKVRRKPREERLTRAHPFNGDLRALPRRKPVKRERPELEGPEPNPTFAPVTPARAPSAPEIGGPSASAPGGPSAPAPAPVNVFEGLDRFNWGAGSPPDTNGDVGPNYYIQTVNTSIGVYRKSDGFQEAAFTFDTFMSQGSFGNLCDNHNFGDPVVLYDTFEDRWIISDFAFLTDVSGNVLAPAFQCIAASKTGNPVTGGWNFYSIQISDNLNDYPKFGIWPDGLYMSANLFSFGAGSTFQGVRVWAFNKAQMYAGAPSVQSVSFNSPTADFTIIPSNARLQTGTPAPGTPNYFLSTWNYTNALSIYKFHANWNRISLSTFTGPDIPTAATSWPNANVANAAQPGTATLLDVLQIRAMVQNQYTNISGAESLWATHTVRRGNTSGFAAPRWYQVNVTGGTVAPTLPQATTWDPDGANVMNRFMPSLAIDRAGNMALGYSTSSSTSFPSIKYAGRLATDPVNTFSLTEQTFFTGTASQTGSTRWGDYSSMTLDPDGCTFWYTNEYANPADQTFNHRWLTKFGSFRYAECTPVGAGGTLSGTVTDSVTSNPISGVTVDFGSRTTTTEPNGVYTFSDLPAGTYPSIVASLAGYGSSTATSIVVTDAATTTQNFSLTAAPSSTCLTDTTQADFLRGVFTGIDLNTSPGDVTLINLTIDQQNTAGTTTGTGFGTPAWTGQTFTPAVNGQLVAADIQLFCNGCGATPPNLTLSVRNTAAGLPTGADLDSVTVPGSVFSSGATVTFTASFGSPATLTSGTQYALILRPVSVPAGSGYFWIRSSPSTYASGSRVLSANSGGTWSTDTTRDYNFKAYMRGPYSPTSGNLISDTKDANPAAGLTPIWSTISWNVSTPANTSLQFQLAGSNSVNGPFNFVGPGGTAETFFTTSPASLGQFYGLRYIQYKAFLSTTDSAVTPTLNDASICFANVDCRGATPAITPAPAQVCENSTGNTASGPAGMTAYSWGITNGTITSATTGQSVTYTAGASGSVTLMLTVTTPSGCIAPNSTLVAINPIPATPTITPDGPTTFCAGDSVTLTSSSASGNQWHLNGNPMGGETNQSYIATAAGNYTDLVTTNGCASASSAPTTVTVNPLPATPTITPGGPTTFCAGDSVLLTSSSASGNQWYLNGNPIGGATNQAYSATATGNYSVTATAGSCTSAPSANTAVTVNPIPATPTITPGGPTTFCAGNGVTLTSSSASGNQWYLNGNPIGGATNQAYVATATGNYTDVVTTSGCASAPSAGTSVTVNPIPSTPTITPGGPTTFCAGNSVTLTSSSVSGNQWYLDGNPIGGATNQAFVATATGNYTDVVTTSGCASAPSTGTAVTVNPIPSTPTITPGGSTTFCAGNSVTLTSSNANGNQWYLNGNPIGGATNQAYVATATGNYTDVVTTSGCASAPSAGTAVTVNPIPVAPTVTPGGPTTFCDNGSVTLTSSSASGNQWYLNGNPIGGATNPDYIATAEGNYSVTVTASGCTSAASSATTVTVNPIPTTPTITAGGPTAFCAGNSVTLTSSSASGNQWYLNGNPIGGATNQAYLATAAGDYSNVATTSGCASALSAATTVTVNPIPPTPTITLSGPTTFCNGNNVTLMSSSATGNQWYLNGNPIVGATNQDYIATAVGNYSVTVTDSGCISTASSATTVTVNPIPATPTITPDGPTTFCTGSSVTLMSSSASGNQWYLDGNPIGGATNQAYIITAAGGYTVTDRASECISAASSATTVTVNPIPATPTITPDGPTTFCTGNSVTLMSSSASGNQWYLDGNPIGGATNQAYTATASGNYTDIVTVSGCASSSSAPTTVTATPSPSTATVGPPQTICPSSSTAPLGGNTPSSSAGTWTVQSGGTGTFSSTSSPDATFTHTGGAGPIVLRWTISNSPCADSIAEVTITVSSAPTLTYASPQSVTFDGSLNVTPTAASALITGYAVQSVVPALTTTPTVNASGVVSITNAQPAGSHVITIRATDNCGANADASFTLDMSKSNQTITFAALENKTFGDADFAVSGTSDSGLALSFAGFGQCTVAGSMVHIMGAGSCTITASQAGNSDYDAAIDLPQSFTIANSALIKLSQSNYNVDESTGFVTITVNRTGDLSTPASVDYATDDTGSSDVCSTLNSGMASARCDFGLTLGTLNFAATETQKTFTIPITQESFIEGPEMFTVNLSNLTGTGIAFASPASATVTISDSAAPAPNASDDTEAFVRQQYRDFLNRDADPAGLAFWTNEITSCGNDAACRDNRRTNVSAAFFLSIEFQTTGNLVRSFYVATLDRPLTNNMPTFSEFELDMQSMQRGLIVGQGDCQQTLRDNGDAFMREFVTRAEFLGLYPATDTPAQYVDKLYLHAGIMPMAGERSNAIAEFGSATTAADAGARGRALLDVTQNTNFQQREINRSFVQMEYFGYLRRNPNDAPDGNFAGYDFWVDKLNAAGGNFIAADMVTAFINSSEYRRRFGP